MLMSFPDLVDKHSLKIHGVVHAGAHLAEEAPLYQELGVGPVTWIEANPLVIVKLAGILEAYPGQRLIQALLWEEDDVEKTFNVTNYDGMSSSILEFGTHPTFSPDTVFEHKLTLRTRTIDSIASNVGGLDANFLNMDLQGVEGPVLQGATKFLKGVDYVMSEVNCEEVYVGCTRVEELDEILSDFERVETYWVPGQGWGDGLWIRRS